MLTSARYSVSWVQADKAMGSRRYTLHHSTLLPCVTCARILSDEAHGVTDVEVLEIDTGKRIDHGSELV